MTVKEIIENNEFLKETIKTNPLFSGLCGHIGYNEKNISLEEILHLFAYICIRNYKNKKEIEELKNKIKELK
jgi:hypothetical protein